MIFRKQRLQRLQILYLFSTPPEIARRRREANEMFEPPDPEALEEARRKRVNEMKMEAILKEICVYGFFVLILFFLSYQQRDMDSFNFTDNLRNLFLGKFEKVRTVYS